ncbi:MAG TPA: asparaginase [Mycobacteriales bacterium]|nr:asparaginase [Mycobacteriales bacterium]
MALPTLAEVVRSGWVECTHVGSVLGLAPDGTTLVHLGTVDSPMLPRSANKPLQAVGMLRAGWQPADDEEIALATASHSGEPIHLDVVRRMLAGAGLDPSALGCPAQLPLGDDAADELLRNGGAASALTMNCSGKHAAMLATCVSNGWPLEGYLLADHPLQLALTSTIEALAGEQVAHLAVDGCGAPQHALSLRGLATAFSRLVRDEPVVADAMRAHPLLVGGTGRDVSRLMAGVPGLLAKDGAEGFYAVALADGTALALKIQDGAARARMPVVVAALRLLGVSAPVLDELATVPVRGGNRDVGEVRATSALR